MKRVHGSSKPWIGRGSDVGKKAWQVLLDWKKESEENHPDKTTDVAGSDADEVSKVIKVDNSEDEED